MDLNKTLAIQRAAFALDPNPAAAVRIDRIDRCVDLVFENSDAICDALNRDFGTRGSVMSRFADVVSPIKHAKYVRGHVRKWMRPEIVKPDFPYGLFGAKTYISYQPLGVIGIVVPWNGPLGMGMAGIIDAFSAGNRVMLKLSEHAPLTAALVADLGKKYFSAEELVFVTGGAEVAQNFTELLFDHLLFTGSSEIGRNVMTAAARNLVPVTLELGGKCPVIVGPDADPADAANKTLPGRLMNSGQGCILPDYVLVPRSQMDAFVAAADQKARKMFPTIIGNADYTSIINDRQFSRIDSYVHEAKAAGCTVIESIPAGEMLPDAARRIIPPTFIVDPPASLRVMKEEVFGPVLAVLPYDTLDSAIRFVNDRPRPLALYYFGKDEALKRKVLEQTISGGVTVNDTAMHFVMSGLPFGGVGNSGTGRYWGGDSGFKRFSNPRGIMEQGWLDKLGELIQPPYGKTIERILRSQIHKTR